MPKPYAESADQNKDVILKVLQQVFTSPGRVLEIGSGTGQHAVHFGAALAHLDWQPSEVEENLTGISLWLDESDCSNVRQPVALDVKQGDWPQEPVDYVFTANTLHIVSWPEVEAMFKGVGRILKSDGLFAIYGPFNYGGRYTSASNAQFDEWLKARNPASGIRNFEDLQQLASQCDMMIDQDFEMPVNNRILVWRKQ